MARRALWSYGTGRGENPHARPAPTVAHAPAKVRWWKGVTGDRRNRPLWYRPVMVQAGLKAQRDRPLGTVIVTVWPVSGSRIVSVMGAASTRAKREAVFGPRDV